MTSLAVRSLLLAAGALASVSGFAGVARADRTFLVGGTVIEGKATRKGDKVVVQVESGEITLPASDVVRIEKSESTVSRFEARYRALPPKDAKARLELADYCRDHDMHAREHQLLLEVLEFDPSNEQARTRLGYVKTDGGWVTQADMMRAQGLVQHDGRWVTQAELLQMERQQMEIENAARQREETEAELAARRAEVANEQAALEAERSRVAWQETPYLWTTYSPYYRGPYRTFGAGTIRTAPVRPPVQSFNSGAFNSTSMSVVKVPYRNH